MAYQYKRRRPSIIRNFWVYRRLIGTAILLGLMLWFIWANGDPVTVAFPFGLGKLSSTTGIVILLSALVGSLADHPGHDRGLRPEAAPERSGPAGLAQPGRPDRGPAPAGLRRENHGRLSQCSLVKLTKKDDGNPLLILSQRDRGPTLSPGPVHLPPSDVARHSAGRPGPRSMPRRRPATTAAAFAVAIAAGLDAALGLFGTLDVPLGRADRRPVEDQRGPPRVRERPDEARPGQARSARTSQIEERLVQQEQDNGELTARLDDARNLLRERGLEPSERPTASPDGSRDPSEGGDSVRTVPAGQSSRSVASRRSPASPARSPRPPPTAAGH